MLQEQFTTVPVAKIGKKKETPNVYRPNSYRVISEDAVRITKQPPSITDTIFIQDLESRNILGASCRDSAVHSRRDHRRNRPNPVPNTSHIRHNVRSLLEPVCMISTDNVTEPDRWWQQSYKFTEKPVSVANRNTTFTDSYQGEQIARVLDTFSKPAARGIVPVNNLREANGEKRVYKEKISMKQFNVTRADGEYQIKGKQKGAFVWNEIPRENGKKILDRLKAESYPHFNNANSLPADNSREVRGQCNPAGDKISAQFSNIGSLRII